MPTTGPGAAPQVMPPESHDPADTGTGAPTAEPRRTPPHMPPYIPDPADEAVTDHARPPLPTTTDDPLDR
ncbi:hypothetical protein GCM10012284_48700 [Mangrovihabitans endophyticus]|uniref:Uncharacterized protein n=1 Tax=Mangrovihabitans endophyticus TaxID=1751298 RepID=A0A8J3FRN2_9ACTN|nr:hypothetical protein GCM10012284_48700 [Mangrovihabitans endophyticus]